MLQKSIRGIDQVHLNGLCFQDVGGNTEHTNHGKSCYEESERQQGNIWHKILG